MRLLATQKRTSRGSIMILTLFILTLLLILGGGFMVLIPVEMRNAQEDREILQGGLGADAALKVALDKLYHDVPYQEIAMADPAELSGGWSYQIEDIEEIEEGVYRVTTSGLQANRVKRRAVAVVDDGSGKFAISVTAKDTTAGQNVNSQGAWPVSVPITGDVYIQGTWYCDNTGLDLDAPNTDRPFKGFIFQTDPSGDAPRGELYEGVTPSNPTQYAAMYDYGIDAIQPYDSTKIAEEELFLKDQVNDRLLSLTFGVDNPAQALAQANGLITAGDPDNDGVLEGGFYLQGDRTVKFSYTAGSQMGRTEFGNGTDLVVLHSKKGAFPDTPETPDSMRVVAPGIDKTYRCDLEHGLVFYVDGEVPGIEGTYHGNLTVAAARGLTITGELLKSDTPRGFEPDASTDALGLIACVDAGSNDPGMSVDMASIPPDNEYFIYAYLTSLSHNDSAAKMFSRSQHPSLPAGTTLTLIGALTWAPTTAGQINTGMDYIAENWKEIIIDSNRPLGFPSGGKYIPRVRSYVDVPVGE